MNVKWIGDENKLDATSLANLVTFHQTAEWNALQVYATHKNILFTANTALLGLGVYVSIRKGPEYFVASLLFPLFFIALRRLSIETLDRYYRRFLEAVVVISKLEFLCGLHMRVSSGKVTTSIDETLAPFPKDQHLDVWRRWDSRANITNSGFWIVDFMGRGHNAVTWNFFRTFFTFSCLVPCFALRCQILFDDHNIPIFFFLAVPIVLVLAVVTYNLDSRTVWKERVKTSLPDMKAEWDTIVKRKLQGKYAHPDITPNEQVEAMSQ